LHYDTVYPTITPFARGMGIVVSKRPSGAQRANSKDRRNPLVFISHDTRDAELAKAFANLLKSACSARIRTFRSSDSHGTEGIALGEEWYARLMEQLQCASHMVCLFTERSLNRPWIFFEAGVAKGKLNIPVTGVALGVPISQINVGPFYQFMNMDDSEDQLIKLVGQLAKLIPNLKPDRQLVKRAVDAFKIEQAALFRKRSSSNDLTGRGGIHWLVGCWHARLERVGKEENTLSCWMMLFEKLPASLSGWVVYEGMVDGKITCHGVDRLRENAEKTLTQSTWKPKFDRWAHDPSHGRKKKIEVHSTRYAWDCKLKRPLYEIEVIARGRDLTQGSNRLKGQSVQRVFMGTFSKQPYC
jgi:TIR domain-containing protein